MNKLRRILSNSLAVFAGLLIAALVLLVALILTGDFFRPMLARFVWESDPDGARPPQEAFDRYRREQDDMANGAERGPIRCTLEPWPPGNGEAPELRLSLTNTSTEPVTLWYHTWPHCHVTFVAYDGTGKAALSFNYGILSSQAVSFDYATNKPRTPIPTRTLQPGENYVAGIALDTLRDYLDVVPGEYTVVAVFVYESLNDFPEAGQHFVGRSQAVTVDVEEPEDDDKKPVWRLHRP